MVKYAFATFQTIRAGIEYAEAWLTTLNTRFFFYLLHTIWEKTTTTSFICFLFFFSHFHFFLLHLGLVNVKDKYVWRLLSKPIKRTIISRCFLLISYVNTTQIYPFDVYIWQRIDNEILFLFNYLGRYQIIKQMKKIE